MRDPAAALAGWASRAPWWPWTLSVRRDLALPLVLLAVQVTGAAVAGGTFNLFNPQRPPGAVDWVLLAAGPVALVARRRHPVPALWVCLAATLPWSPGNGWAHVSFIIAFFVAATAGKRYWAWLALAIDFAGTIWLAPLIYDHAIPPLNDTLLLSGWLLALVIAAEGGGAFPHARDPAPGPGRAAPPPERGAAAGRQGPARRDRPRHLAHQRPGQHGA